MTQFQQYQKTQILAGNFTYGEKKPLDGKDKGPDGVYTNQEQASKRNSELESQKNLETQEDLPESTAHTEEKDDEPLPQLPFQFHLNLPNPVPLVNTADIKSLAAPQRVNIFKQLQKRERNKFLSI